MLFKAATLSSVALVTLGFIDAVNGHGFVTQIKGANGKTVNGFGVNAASITPGNQGPTSVFKGGAPCGVGVEAGTIDVPSSIEAAIKAGLPTADSTGILNMIWQQVNAGNDGGGPGSAAIDITGTGNNFKPLTITKNFGDGGANSANPMTVQFDPTTVCTGGSNGATCLVKVTNPVGPFGSCFAVASPASGGAQNNGAQNTGNQQNAGANAGASTTTSAAAASGTTSTASGTCSKQVTVAAGDRCGTIAKAAGISVKELKAQNPGVKCKSLAVGSSLCVAPAAQKRADIFARYLVEKHQFGRA